MTNSACYYYTSIQHRQDRTNPAKILGEDLKHSVKDKHKAIKDTGSFALGSGGFALTRGNAGQKRKQGRSPRHSFFFFSAKVTLVSTSPPHPSASRVCTLHGFPCLRATSTGFIPEAFDAVGSLLLETREKETREKNSSLLPRMQSVLTITTVYGYLESACCRCNPYVTPKTLSYFNTTETRNRPKGEFLCQHLHRQTLQQRHVTKISRELTQ